MQPTEGSVSRGREGLDSAAPWSSPRPPNWDILISEAQLTGCPSLVPRLTFTSCMCLQCPAGCLASCLLFPGPRCGLQMPCRSSQGPGRLCCGPGELPRCCAAVLDFDESGHACHLSCYDFVSHTRMTQTRVLCRHRTTQLPPSVNSSIQSLGALLRHGHNELLTAGPLSQGPTGFPR